MYNYSLMNILSIVCDYLSSELHAKCNTIANCVLYTKCTETTDISLPRTNQLAVILFSLFAVKKVEYCSD